VHNHHNSPREPHQMDQRSVTMRAGGAGMDEIMAQKALSRPTRGSKLVNKAGESRSPYVRASWPP
jgi:hypothetical protein